MAFWRDDQGQGLVEYALIISVIAIAVIVAMVFLRGQLQIMFSNIGNKRRCALIWYTFPWLAGIRLPLEP